MGLAHIDHGLNKVLAVQTEYPCNTNDEVLLQRVRHRQLTFQFGLAIDIQRLIVLTIRLPRLGSLSVKHIVRGQIEHFAIQFLAGISNVLGTACINFSNSFYLIVIFCHIHSSPCSTVDHRIRFDSFNHLGNRIFICDVQLYIVHSGNRATICDTCIGICHIRTDALMTSFIQFIHDIMAQLTINACYEELHINFSPCSSSQSS